MRMITACFARAPQGCTSRIYMHFLLIFHEVQPIRKTRNQLQQSNCMLSHWGLWLSCRSLDIMEINLPTLLRKN